MSKTDLSHLIERLEVVEAKHGIELRSLFAGVVPDTINGEEALSITINGEIVSRNGRSIPHDLNLKVSIFDLKRKMVACSEDYIEADKFFVLRQFSCWTFAPIDTEIGSIRVHTEEGYQ